LSCTLQNPSRSLLPCLPCCRRWPRGRLRCSSCQRPDRAVTRATYSQDEGEGWTKCPRRLHSFLHLAVLPVLGRSPQCAAHRPRPSQSDVCKLELLAGERDLCKRKVCRSSWVESELRPHRRGEDSQLSRSWPAGALPGHCS